MAEVTVPHKQLKKLVRDKLMKVNVPEHHANIISDVLVHANLRNVNSHGVLRTEHYVKRIRSGGMNIDPKIRVKKTGPVSAIVDGDDGMGHVIAKEAMDTAIELSKENGAGFVGVINSSHCGALSYFVEQAAEEGLIGFATTHSDKLVVPFGGSEPFFGTNPIAYGFPTKRNSSVILDMATSNVAFGKVLHAQESGQTIPENWGVDQDGSPTSDPHQVSALLPFAGPKGYGLAMVVDILSGILTGSSYGPFITPMYGDYEKMRGLSHFVATINPEMFVGKEKFMNQLDNMIDSLHEQKPASGYEQVMVPGEPEQQYKDQRLKEGIPVTRSIYDYLISENT